MSGRPFGEPEKRYCKRCYAILWRSGGHVGDPARRAEPTPAQQAALDLAIAAAKQLGDTPKARAKPESTARPHYTYFREPANGKPWAELTDLGPLVRAWEDRSPSLFGERVGVVAEDAEEETT